MLVLISLLFSFSSYAPAQETEGTLPALQIRATADAVLTTRDLDGTKLLAGKKATLIQKKETAETPQNSYRQTLAQLPGLVVTEVNNESYASMSYRGLGDPHESFNILLLRDSLPIAADPYGYPASYYVPPMDAVEKIDFIRGGSGLLFGPQPGGVLNFQLRAAPSTEQTTSIRSKQTFGAFQTYSTYNEVSAGYEKWSYLTSLHYRKSEGFRDTNSDYSVLDPRLNLSYRLSSSQKLSFDADYYQASHHDPGNLALTPAAGVLAFADSRTHNTLQHDHLEIRRSQFTLGYDRSWSEAWLTEAKVWAGRYDRTSFRQKFGAAPAFGGLPLGTGNTIEAQGFFSRGGDLRNLVEYSLFDQPQHLTFGLTYLEIQSPFSQDDGTTPSAESGKRTKDMDRSTRTTAMFAENQFTLGKFSVSPGVRYESIKQSIDENLNLGSAVPLRSKTSTAGVLLMGLGLQYQLATNWQPYANVSQGYKPATFTDTVPRSTGATVSEDIRPARILSRELGIRAQNRDGYFDASVFWINYSDQFGQIGTNFQNVGSGEHKGADLAVGHRLFGDFSSFANASWLNAKYTHGAANGRTPAYAPGYVYRFGLDYKKGDHWKVQLQAQILDHHYGNDNNTALMRVPGYSVWDLSGQAKLGRFFDAMDTYVHWGVQNLADKKYYARVRSNGVEPAQPRTIYAGLTLML